MVGSIILWEKPTYINLSLVTNTIFLYSFLICRILKVIR